MKNFHNTATYN